MKKKEDNDKSDMFVHIFMLVMVFFILVIAPIMLDKMGVPKEMQPNYVMADMFSYTDTDFKRDCNGVIEGKTCYMGNENLTFRYSLSCNNGYTITLYSDEDSEIEYSNQIKKKCSYEKTRQFKGREVKE